MINLLVISHSDLAHGLLSAAGLIVGEVPHAASMGLYPGKAFDEFVAEVGEKIKSMDEGDGVLVLVDLFGGCLLYTSSSPSKQTGRSCVNQSMWSVKQRYRIPS